MNDIFMSLGSNIDSREYYLSKAIEKINKLFTNELISSIYKTEPLMDVNQDFFYNIMGLWRTEYDNPHKVLEIIQNIEKEIGRVKDKNRPKGPRVIDIDIINFGFVKIELDDLIIPHKDYKNRNFVLIPYVEILDKLIEADDKKKDKYKILKDKLIEHISENNNQDVYKIGELNFGSTDKSNC